MIGATWNVRGLNKTGKLQCITDFVVGNKLDFVGFQETKKDNFDDAFSEPSAQRFYLAFLAS